MASPRRIGAPDAKNRAILLDAAERLMLEEGYAAVSSRRVAAKAGLKPQLVHYYFRTMDDLFLAAFRRRAEEALERQARVLASPQPLRALWEFNTDPRGTALTMEFAALANHRKAMRAELVHYAEQVRIQQLDALSGLLERRTVDPEAVPPIVMMVLLTTASQVLAIEESLGMSAGHAETVEFVERCLQQFEGPAANTVPDAPGPR
ncbi:TetR/AcrR family transcriptional regulator [Actinomadura scrupuli]|uniref:TetR/AcrR family transcriptional regulator n=1 Tax=Actinomadura scrupuli TaxID=559629 RepID=UPI003D993D31